MYIVPKIIPLELRDLNELVARLHRHHKPVQGHRFSVGVELDGTTIDYRGLPVITKHAAVALQKALNS